MSDHLIAEANRHAKALPKMTLPTTKPNDLDLAWYRRECELLQDRNEALERENAALNHKLDEILTNKNYEGGVQFWINKHDEVLLREASLLAENAALRADNERLANAAKEVLASYILTMGVELGHPCPENLVECRELRAAIDATRKEAQP